MPTLPPTFLRTTLFTNELTGNVTVNGTVNLLSNLHATYFIGNGSQLTGLDQAALPAEGHLDVVGNLTGDSANVNTLTVGQTAYFTGQVNVIGNLSTQGDMYATGIYATGLQTTGVVNAGSLNTSTVDATTVTATEYYGDGTNMTGVLHEIPNDLVVNSVYAGDNVATGYLTASGNVTGNYFIGNGALLTGLPEASGNVSGNISVENIAASGNVDVSENINVAGNVTADLIRATRGIITDLDVLTLTTGNVTAVDFFIGNGSLLTGIPQYELPGEIAADVLGNVTATGNVTAEYFLGNGALLTGVTTSLPDDLSVVTLTASANVTTADLRSNAAWVGDLTAPTARIGTAIVDAIQSYGNATAEYFVGNGAFLTGLPEFALPGEIAADILGNVTAAGNVTAGLFIGNGALLTDIPQYALPGEITADVLGNVTAAGNVTAGMFYGDGLNLTNVLHDIPAELTVDTLSATANVTADYFLGNGALLTGVVADVPADLSVNSLTATGNVTAQHLVAPTVAVNDVFATNLYGDGTNLTGVLHEIPNDLTVNSVTANGFIGDGAQLTNVLHEIPADLFVNSLNAAENVTTGYITAAANVTADHFIGNGALLTDVVATVSGDITVGNITASGNVTADYFLGSGATMTGDINSTANVVTTGLRAIRGMIDDLEAFNVYSANLFSTGNVTGMYFIGNGALLTGLPEASGNVSGNISVDNITASGNVDVEQNLNVFTGRVNAFKLYTPEANVGTINADYATVTANMNAGQFFGDGSNLTGVLHEIPADLSVDTLAATGNVSADHFIGNGALLEGVLHALPSTISADINGNVLATNYVNSENFIGNNASLGGNVSASYFIGNGALLTDIPQYELPGEISADVLGNVTAAGNVTAGYFVGNGAFLTGIEQYALPSVIAADLIGNVAAPGYLSVTGDLNANNVVLTGQISALGNIYANWFQGNTLNFEYGSIIDLAAGDGSIIGNTWFEGGNIATRGQVNVTGNVVATNFIGNGYTLNNVLHNESEITGALNLTSVSATGNVVADYFVGNGYNLVLDGYLLKPEGNVADEAARLALPAPVGTVVTQLDNNQQYMLLALPASDAANWLEFTGANYPVTSVFGRVGEVVLISGTDVSTIGGTSIVGNGDITALAVDLVGNVYAPESVTAGQFFGDGAALTNVLHEIPADLNVDTLTATGNVSAAYFLGNGALLTGIEQYVLPSEIAADVLGNVTATGNVSAAYFLGNGALLTGIEQYVLPSEITADVLGNVTATGNVTAGMFYGDGINLTGVLHDIPADLSVDTLAATGNATADYFIGNGALLTGLSGIVANVSGNIRVDSLYSTGNVDVSNNINVYGNVIAGGFISQKATINDITAGSINSGDVFSSGHFIGNGALLTDIPQYALPGEISADVLGNVTATGNVSAGLFIGNGALLTDIPQYTLPGEISADVLGNVTAPGTVNAAFFVGDGSALTGVLHEIPTDLSVDTLTATANVTAEYFLGNGALLTGIEQYVLPSEITADVLGNVTATGNVTAGMFFGDGTNLTGVLHDIPADLSVDTVTAAGNVTATYFLGNGALLTGVATEIPANLAVTNLNAANAVFTESIFATNLVADNLDAAGNVNVAGNVTAGYLNGNGINLSGVATLGPDGMVLQTNLDGYLVVPQGYVANAQVRLALGAGTLPIGSIARQIDNGNSYMLTTTPSNVDLNWFEFTGTNFPVTTVYGRIGDVLASYGDYFDDQIELASNVGPVPAGNAVSEALSYLYGQVEYILSRLP